MQKIEHRIDRALARCHKDTVVRVRLDPSDYRALMAVAAENIDVSLAPGRALAPRYKDLPVERIDIGSSHVVGRRVGTAQERPGMVLI